MTGGIHMYFYPTGDLFKNKPFYLYTSLGVGSFFNQSHIEQGMADLKVDFYLATV